MGQNLLNIICYFHSRGITDPIKLQKMLYISFGYYSFYNNDKDLFCEKIVAWKYGPVVPDAYYYLCKEYFLRDKKPKAVPADKKESIDSVIDIYNDKAPFLLVELIHQKNTPWSNSYKCDLNIEISKNKIKEYYSSFLTKTDKIVRLMSTKDFEEAMVELSKT